MYSRISYRAINSKYVTWIFYDEYTELKEWDSLQDAETYIREKEKEEDNKMNKLMYPAEEVNQILFEITLDKARVEEKLQKIEQIINEYKNGIDMEYAYPYLAKIREVLEKE